MHAVKIILHIYRMVKNFGGKKFGEKAVLQGLAKKNLANVDLYCQSPIKD